MSALQEDQADEQRRAALVQANEMRGQLAALRRELRTHPHRLAAVLLDPPACVHGMPMIDVLRMVRAKRRRAWGAQWIGERALADGVNLLVPVDRASRRTREWAARHGLAWCQTSRAREVA